jgi:hypothetical protein
MDKEVLNLLVSRVRSTALGETVRGSRKWASSFRAVAEGNDELSEECSGRMRWRVEMTASENMLMICQRNNG